MIARLMIGSNPLVGVDHFSFERARKVRLEESEEKALQVLRTAFAAGATGFTFSPGLRAINLLKGMRDSKDGSRIRLYPVLPALEKYWPAFMAKGTYGLVSSVLEDLSWAGKAKAMIRGGAAALTSNPLSSLGLYIDVELEKIKAASPEHWQIDTVFLGEMFTDMALSLGATNLLRTYRDAVERSGRFTAGLQTRNFAKLVAVLKTGGWTGRFPVVMAPFNPIGFQMTPTREKCEEAATGLVGLDVVGISVLAAGQLGLREACSYLRGKDYIKSVAIGTSDPKHAKETFEFLAGNFRHDDLF